MRFANLDCSLIMLTQGTVIHAGYRVLERIGQGEIGEVYRAERVGTGQLCALKVLSAGLMDDSVLVGRFTEEAKRASTIRHPNAVRIEGVGEAEDGRPFVVMEYLPGENMRDVMAREGRLPASRACFIARQVATVLQVAHALGFVHQDVTPGNIMLVETPVGTQVRLLDCCVARIKEDRRRDMSRIALGNRGVLMGTPEYFSPEMAVGKSGSELDGRSDLYSLGVVLFQMLCGELPFETKTGAMDALLAHLLIPLERMLRETSAPEAAVASPRETGKAAPGGLPSGALTLTLPPDSPCQTVDETLGTPSDTEKPEAPVRHPPLPVVARPAPIQKMSRRWPRWAAATAITALSLGLVAWFLARPRPKLSPYFEPGASAPRSSREVTGRTGQTGQGIATPAPQRNTSPAANSPGTTSAVLEASPDSTGTKPGARTSKGVGEQAVPLGEGTLKASQAPHRPNLDLATVRALTAEGDKFFRQGQYDRATQSYQKALRLDPSSGALQAKIRRAGTAKAAEQKYLNE